MKRTIIILFYLHIITLLIGQTNILKGVVTATDGELLIGVNIKVKDTGRGTITDIDGNFQLAVEPGEHLVLTYIGFKDLEYVVGAQKNVQIELEPDQTSLDEVLVVGYGKAKRITMTELLPANCALYLQATSRMPCMENCQVFLHNKLRDNRVRMLQISLFVARVH